MKLAAGLILTLFVAAAAVADEPVVRVELDTESVTIGESIKMTVTVLGPTWFPKPPQYPSFEITNAVVRLPPNSSFPISERRGRATWSGIVRNYEIIPLVAGNFAMKDLAMQITYADPDTVQAVSATIALPVVSFQAVVPAGAESLDPYIAGTDLRLSRELNRDIDKLAAGDAVVVTYVAELDGLPSMFIPDFLPLVEIPGVSVYPAEPRFSDAATATRTEQLTVVFEAGGKFEIPAVSLDWWNASSARVATTSVPPIVFNVSGPPVATEPAEPAAATPSDWRGIAFLALLLIACAWQGPRLLRRMRSRRADREQQRLASESYAFDQLQQALSSGDAASGYQRLIVWLDRLGGPSDPNQFAEEYGDASLVEGLTALRASLFASTVTTPDLRALASGLASAKSNFYRTRQDADAALLPSLNP